MTLEERFWAKVNRQGEADCWNWTAAVASNGYGLLTICVGKQESSHRLAWRLTHGEIPKGVYVCHTCDNRQCCNPAHLFIGTPRDNAMDMAVKGRHGKAKLTPAKVLAIRAAYPLKTQAELGREFGVTKEAIAQIVTRFTWRHV